MFFERMTSETSSPLHSASVTSEVDEWGRGIFGGHSLDVAEVEVVGEWSRHIVTAKEKGCPDLPARPTRCW